MTSRSNLHWIQCYVTHCTVSDVCIQCYVTHCIVSINRQHPTIPVLFEDAPCSSFTSQSTSSSDSIDRHSGVHHSDVRHTAPSNRLDSSSSNLHSTHKSFQPIVVAPSQSSPVSTVVSPAALTPIPHSPGVYAYPGAVSAGPHAVLDERTLFCG